MHARTGKSGFSGVAVVDIIILISSRLLTRKNLVWLGTLVDFWGVKHVRAHRFTDSHPHTHSLSLI